MLITKKQEVLKQELDATFSHNYLNGYFDTSCSEEFGIMYIDYNRILGKMLEEYHVGNGQCANLGTHTGKVKIITNPGEGIEEDDILVCEMTSPDFIPLMKKAGAIITAQGGLLTHAAIIARELKKPCLVGVENAMELEEGKIATVNAEQGTIRYEDAHRN